MPHTHSPSRLRPVLAAVLVSLTLATGCSAGSASSDAGDPPASTTAGSEGCRTPEDAAGETEAPVVEVPADLASTPLATDDIVGCGDVVGDDSTAMVQYVLVSADTGEEVDSSWSRGEPFSLSLGQGLVIPGWDQEVPGMRAGGRRTLVLPPELAYGPAGSGSPLSGQTLVFIIDVLSVVG